jgi:hypothetical protein
MIIYKVLISAAYFLNLHPDEILNFNQHHLDVSSIFSYSLPSTNDLQPQG